VTSDRTIQFKRTTVVDLRTSLSSINSRVMSNLKITILMWPRKTENETARQQYNIVQGRHDTSVRRV